MNNNATNAFVTVIGLLCKPTSQQPSGTSSLLLFNSARSLPSSNRAIGFLGFDFRRVKTLRGKWEVRITPKMKARTALLRKLKEIFRRYQSQPVDRVIELINPVLRGWVNYFRIGHSSRCFGYVKDWVEKKVRRHLMRARNRKGFGWDRWSREWLYKNLGLYRDYEVRYCR